MKTTDTLTFFELIRHLNNLFRKLGSLQEVEKYLTSDEDASPAAPKVIVVVGVFQTGTDNETNLGNASILCSRFFHLI
jgi:rRNA pseudouridine-1189 N-methylase Emg1 (Nep1/Mra1 family)